MLALGALFLDYSFRRRDELYPVVVQNELNIIQGVANSNPVVQDFLYRTGLDPKEGYSGFRKDFDFFMLDLPIKDETSVITFSPKRIIPQTNFYRTVSLVSMNGKYFSLEISRRHMPFNGALYWEKALYNILKDPKIPVPTNYLLKNETNFPKPSQDNL